METCMKKKKLSEHNAKLRKERILKFYEEYGDAFEKCIESGYSIGDLKVEFPTASHRLLWYCIGYSNLTDLVKHNNKAKRQKTARFNGKKSAITLKGIPLKPVSDEIIEWYKNCVDSGMYKMEVMNLLKQKFGYGRKKYGQLVELYGSPKKNPQSGKLNPMYGKSPGNNAGNGIKAWVVYGGNKLFCRSLLELRIFLFLIDNNIKFEISKHRIKYKNNNTEYTYCPDITFVDTNVIAEVKPDKLVNTELNTIKFNAARNYCNKYGLGFDIITENTYDISKFDLSYINTYISKGIVIIDDVEYERLKQNLK